jgi:UDP-N-acetyl-D-glucosamine dehydrogenase
MPYYVIDKVVHALNERGKSIKSSRVLVMGLAYKKDIDDTRESPSLKLIELLMQNGAIVDYNDPYIPQTRKMRKYDFNKNSVTLTQETLKQYDCVVIATDHTSYDYELIVNNSALVVDTRNATRKITNNGNIVRA